jgi:uncharacterized membrane protein
VLIAAPSPQCSGREKVRDGGAQCSAQSQSQGREARALPRPARVLPLCPSLAGMILSGFIAFVALVIAIVAVAQGNILRARIENLEKERRATERSPVQPPPIPKIPPPLPKWLQEPAPPVPPPPFRTPVPDQVPGIDWESLLGVRLFAWIGGLALFFGVIFFVKYAFERNLITPSTRVIIGGAVGIALVLVSLLPALRRYRVPAQSLCATGFLILYADIYAAHAFYDLIALTAAMVLMWLTTAIALILAMNVEAQSIAWLALFGGFLTPFLVRTGYSNPILLFGYIGVLNCGIAAVSASKRWNHLILLAAIGSIIVEFTWAAEFFGETNATAARIVFLAIQSLFLAICIVLARARLDDNWNTAAAALAGFATLTSFIQNPRANLEAWDFGFSTIFLGAAGLIALGAVYRESKEKSKASATIVGITLGLTVLAEWSWWYAVFAVDGLNDAPLVASPLASVGAWHFAIFVLFAATPYLCDEKRTWPWMIAAISGPPQFAFGYYYFAVLKGVLPPVIPHQQAWLIPVAFAIPGAIGIFHLVRRRGVDPSSGDSRLASQGAVLITFISLIFPVQFHREWITLGWAIEGVALILLFRWLPNRRLRAIALIVLVAAFIRLALNPAVLRYHPRSHRPILNWYLYTDGVAGLCFLFGARWFGPMRERRYERYGPPLLYTLGGIVFFLLLNIEIADYFSIGPTLTFSFAGNFARDMTYTISWALFAFAVLILGMIKQIPALRFSAVALLCLSLVKLFLHDLDALSQLYRIAAFVSVAIIAIVASFAYQRFLSPAVKK